MGIPQIIIGIALWGTGHTTTQPYISPQQNPQKIIDAAANIASYTLSALFQVQILRKQGYLEEAEKLAIQHLKTEPKDIDVRLVLGLIQKQQKKYVLAEYNLNKVLSEYPDYLDARIALIQLKLDNKKLKDGLSLIESGLKITPNASQLLTFERTIKELEKSPKHISATFTAPLITKKFKKNIPHLTQEQINLRKIKHYEKNKEYKKQLNLLLFLVKNNMENESYRLALADYYITHHQDMKALDVVLEGLRKKPDHVDLLIKKGEIQILLQEYSRASLAFHNALRINPQNKKAKGFLEEINEINPQYNYGINQLGFFTDNIYVNDLHSIWNYSTLYYNRDLEKGSIGGRVNYASRQNLAAAQFQFDYSPRFTRNIYFDLSAALANKPELFPQRMVRGEGYFKLNPIFEISGGTQYSQLLNTYFTTYTSSLNAYLGNNWFSFRPYLFVPKTNNKSTLYTATIRHYFATVDHFISVTAGSGTIPDISDLLTVDFIIIKNKLVNLTYEFPILNHKFAINTGIGYQQWHYPSNLVRELYDAKLGVKYRF